MNLKAAHNQIAKYEKQKQREMKKLKKAYLKDYTEFNYKIDSILNEGYTFIKKAEPKVFPPLNIRKDVREDIPSKDNFYL